MKPSTHTTLCNLDLSPDQDADYLGLFLILDLYSSQDGHFKDYVLRRICLLYETTSHLDVDGTSDSFSF